MEHHDLTAALQRAHFSEWLGDFQDARAQYEAIGAQLGPNDELLVGLVRRHLAALQELVSHAEIHKNGRSHFSIAVADQNEAAVRLDIRGGHPEGVFPNLKAHYQPGADWTIISGPQSEEQDEADIVSYLAESAGTIHLFVAIEESGIVTGTATVSHAMLQQALPRIASFLRGLMDALWGPVPPRRDGQVGQAVLTWTNLLQGTVLEMLEGDAQSAQPQALSTEAFQRLVALRRLDEDMVEQLEKSLALRDAAVHSPSEVTEQDLALVTGTVTRLIGADAARGPKRG